MVKIVIQKKIKDFDKVITVDSDKSLSIRSLLISSQSIGVSKIKNLSKSGDIMSTLSGLRKLGIKIKLTNKICYVYGCGLNGFNYRKKISINAGNSGTFARLILGLLVHSPYEVKLIGDKSLSRRDFLRIITPLKEFGANFKKLNNNGLPLKIFGSEFIKPINYIERRGSAQCKSSVILAALSTPGKTIIKAKKSRDHTELFLKYLRLPIKIERKNKYDLIEINGQVQFKSFDYFVPGDASSSAFFIVLTLLLKNSKLKIKNVNINPSRIGFIKIINKMGGKIKFTNKKTIYGEKVADVCVKSQKNFKSINCPVDLNSSAIDEFLLIFLVAAKAKGVSTFKKLDELNKKESPRLKWGSRILNLMGVKNQLTSSSIKIFGNPEINLKKKITIKNFLKDHRVFMSSVIAALSFGGEWHIHDKNSIKTSFPDFLKILKNLQK